jgi:hypothetical protein
MGTTWRLHDDTNKVGPRKLYTGSADHPGCDIGESADCQGPGLMSCYWGAFYVNSVKYHRLRTGPFMGGCDADWPGTGTTERVRWASHLGASAWEPEYRFVGRLIVHDIMVRPSSWTGLVLHPVHLDNCNNCWVRLWERDDPSHVVWGREVNDQEHWVTEARLFCEGLLRAAGIGVPAADPHEVHRPPRDPTHRRLRRHLLTHPFLRVHRY